MTISSQTRTAGPYIGTGLVSAYPFSFKVFVAADLRVVRADLSGVESDLVLSVDYTVALNADQNSSPGGVVNLLAQLASGFQLTVTSGLSVTQGTSITNGGGFYPKVIEDALDRLTILMQEQGFVSRQQFLRVVDIAGVPAIPQPAASRANKLLSFDDDGNPTAVAIAAQSATQLQFALASGNGTSMVGQQSPLTDSVLRTVYLNLIYKKNLNDWCDGNGIDETTQITKAFAACAASGVQVLECKTDANYVWTGQQTLADRMSIAGNGCKFSPVNDGFKTLGGAVDIGATFYRDFAMLGSSSTANTGIAIAQNTTLARTRGVRFENIVLDRFLNALSARSMWDGIIDGCHIYRSKFGVSFIGQCVSNSIRNSHILSTVAAQGDGSVGVYVDQFTYADAVARRPEAILIDGETRVYGFDTNVWVNRCLKFSAVNSDFDAALKYGIRATTVDSKIVVANNYIACVGGASAVYGIRIDDLGSANASAILVADNDIWGVGTMPTGSVALYVGTNRTGKKVISRNTIGAGVPFDYGLQFATINGAVVEHNVINGVNGSLLAQNGGSNKYVRNDFNAPIQRSGTRTKDEFDHNGGTATTCFHGLIVYPATVTTTTLSDTTDLGLSAAIVTGAPANLLKYCKVTQVTGATSMGFIRARDSGSGGVIVDRTVSLGGASADIWLDMESY